MAAVEKDNSIVTFNEEEIFKGKYNIFHSERDNNYAFILNMLFLFENSFHDKGEVINHLTNSPLIFLDENFNSSFNMIAYNFNEGEAGHFIERFIGDIPTILGLLNCSNKLGNLLDIKYFNKKDFTDLIQGYKMLKEKNDKENDEIIEEYHLLNDSYNPNKMKIINKNPRFEERDKTGFNNYDRYLFRLSKLKGDDF